jgi:hypothetical protein
MTDFYDLQLCYADDAFSISGVEQNYDLPDRYAIHCQPETNLEAFFSNFVFKVNQKGKKQSFLANNLGWIIVDSKFLDHDLVKTFGREGCTIWPMPSNLIEIDGELENYRILLVRHAVDCVDYSRSRIEWGIAHDGHRYIASFQKLVIDPARAGSLNICRLEPFPSIVLISHWYFERLTRSNLSGWRGVHVT